jgi:hypothetical protein
MSKTFLRVLFLGAAIGLATTTVMAQDCSRADLAGTVDLYFDALLAHDPVRLPLADDLRFTENGQVTSLTDGFWQTAGRATFRRSLLDTATCGTMTQAVVEENGEEGPAIYGVRLKLDSGQLTEIETYVARATEFAQNPEGVPEEDGDSWASILPAAERSSRADIVAAGNAYFDMFFDPPNTEVPFRTPCNRRENGTRTTQGDCGNLGPAGAGGMRMTHRRFPLVDEETGTTAGFVLFNDGLLDVHMFKVRDGEITQIQAIVGPSSETTGWEDQEP